MGGNNEMKYNSKRLIECPKCHSKNLNYMETGLRAYQVINGVMQPKGNFKLAQVDFICDSCGLERTV